MSNSTLLSKTFSLRTFIIIGLVAFAYVILRSCSTPKIGLETYATGGVKRFKVIEGAPLRPKMSFKDIKGQDITLDAIADGDMVLLNVWASWCPPCVKELPSLIELKKAKEDKNFKVVFISLDRTMQDAQAYIERIGLEEFTTYHDPTTALLQAVASRTLPVTLIYDKNGSELGRFIGDAEFNSPEAFTLIEVLKAR